jgi:nitroreductase
MKRSLFALLLLPAALATAQELKPVTLPAPQTTGGKPLMQALKERKTGRAFAAQPLPPQVLSNLLWAAWGINREDGRRTAPSASNRQEIKVYVVTADGAWVYDAKGNTLQPAAAGDHRKLTGTNPFVATAPLNLVFVADLAKMGTAAETNKLAMANANTGFISQNVYLFCASEGLATVVRAGVNREALTKALSLRPDQRITLAQTVGYPQAP